MSAAMQNPPLASYYLALVGQVFGWSEIALHAGFLVPARWRRSWERTGWQSVFAPILWRQAW